LNGEENTPREEIVSTPTPPAQQPRRRRFSVRLTPRPEPQESTQRSAELFYLQKQIQAQTPMVFVLEDGERVEGIIEWYDRDVIKIRGRARALLYKSAIRYMHKLGENS
jgi:hypothetical protein